MMLANCFLAVFQPRYTLPMWELTIISVAILFGGIMDALFFHHAGWILQKVKQAKDSDHAQGS